MKISKKSKEKAQPNHFYGFSWVSFGDPNVNYPNTIIALMNGIAFIAILA